MPRPFLKTVLAVAAFALIAISHNAIASENRDADLKFRLIGTEDGLPSEYVTAVEAIPGDSQSVMVGTWKGVVKFNGLTFETPGRSSRIEGFIPQNVSALYYDRGGTLWIGSMFYENAGLYKYTDGKFVRYSTIDGLPVNDVTSITGDGEKLYVGTWGGGVASMEDSKFTVFNKGTSLSDDFVSVVAADHVSKNVWAGTKFAGANLIKGGKIEIFDDHTSQLLDNYVHSIAIDTTQNTFYFGTSGGLSSFNGASWINRIKGRDSLGSNFVRRIFIARSTIYLATDNGLSIITEGGCRNVNFDEKTGFRHCQINDIHADDRTIYLGTDRGLYKIGRGN